MRAVGWLKEGGIGANRKDRNGFIEVYGMVYKRSRIKGIAMALSTERVVTPCEPHRRTSIFQVFMLCNALNQRTQGGN